METVCLCVVFLSLVKMCIRDRLTPVEGETYELSQLHSIAYTNDVTQQQATVFANQLAATAGIQLNVEPCTTDRKDNAISVVIDLSLIHI